MNNFNKSLTIGGDPHGAVTQVRKYYDRTVGLGKNHYASCLGDICPLDADYSWLQSYAKHTDILVSPFGNHDHESMLNQPTVVRSYKFIKQEGMPSMFFLSGGYSINRDYIDAKGMYWNPREELGTETLEEAIRVYHKVKPDILITHEACQTAIDVLGMDKVGHLKDAIFKPRSVTAQAIERMYELHKPYLLVNGHWHIDDYTTIKNEDKTTHVLSVGKRSVLTIDLDTIYGTPLGVGYFD